LACYRRADIGFALVVRSYNVDRFAQHFAAGVFDSHTRRNDVPRTAKVGVHPGKISEHTNPHQVI
jgi:hypothetical protein